MILFWLDYLVYGLDGNYVNHTSTESKYYDRWKAGEILRGGERAR